MSKSYVSRTVFSEKWTLTVTKDDKSFRLHSNSPVTFVQTKEGHFFLEDSAVRRSRKTIRSGSCPSENSFDPPFGAYRRQDISPRPATGFPSSHTVHLSAVDSFTLADVEGLSEEQNRLLSFDMEPSTVTPKDFGCLSAELIFPLRTHGSERDDGTAFSGLSFSFSG